MLDPVMIELPKGTYLPCFHRRSSLTFRARSALRSARAAMNLRTVSGYASAIKRLDAALAEAPNDSLVLALKAEALCLTSHSWIPPATQS
jgi:hypothetical protein